MIDRATLLRRLALAVLCLGALLRLVVLDADPKYYAWAGYIVDEGRWIETARMLALGNPLAGYGRNLHLVLAPLYQAIHVPLLALFGPSFWVTRLPTALIGCVLPVVAYAALRRRVRPEAAILTLVLIATQADFVCLSRISIPEMPVMLIELLVYVVLSSRVESRRALLFAGGLTLTGLALKATMAPLIAIFVVVVLVLPRSTPQAGRLVRRLGDAALYVASVIIPLCIAGGIALVLRGVDGGGLGWQIDVVRERLAFGSPLDLVGLPIWSVLAPTLALFMIGPWYAALAWLTCEPERLGFAFRRDVAGLLAWTGTYYVLMSLVEYFPHRYETHILIPLALLAAFASDAIVRIGVTRIVSGIQQQAPAAKSMAITLLTIPSAVILAPPSVAALLSLGLDSNRLRVRLGAIVFLAVLLAVLACARPVAARVRALLIGAPPAFALAWHGLSLVPSWPDFWDVTRGRAYAAAWTVTLVVSLAAFAALRLSGRERREPSLRRGRAVLATAAAFGCIAIAGYGGGLLRPTYTIRDTSLALGTLLADADSIVSHSTEALFNQNRLSYASAYRVDPVRDEPEYFVSTRPYKMYGSLRRHLARHYDVVAEYRLAISPQYARASIHDREIVEALFHVTVHRRRADDEPPERP